MKIKPKFRTGQTVCFASHNDNIFDGKIEYIICYGDSVSYKVSYQNGEYIAPERDIFPSEKEARKELITRRIARTKRMLEQDEIRLAELEKEEKEMSESETEFTPGPWKVREDSGFANHSKAVTNKDGIVLAEIVNFHNDRENAALISAAPEMYEALSEAVERYGKPGGPWNVPSEPGSWIEKAKAALKKARGEA